MKLEIAAGYARTPGYDVYADINPNCNPDVVCDAVSLPFDDESFDGLRAVDILEHMSYTVTHVALAEWARVLKPGGELYVQVPDVRMAVEDYLAGVDRPGYRPLIVPELEHLPPIVSLAWRLLGGHDTTSHVTEGDDWRWNAHYALFDESSLTWYLGQAGFTVRSIETNFHPNLLCWAIKNG